MQIFQDSFQEYVPGPADGPWCLKIQKTVYGPFSTYERVEEVVATMDLGSPRLYFDQIWAWRWKGWDTIFGFYTDFPIPTQARRSEPDVIPSIKWGKGVTQYATDGVPYTHAPCPRHKVMLRQMRSMFSKQNLN